ncbi:hypothetical protein MMYC01_206652 [Madurella mycetomatis]|uniref:Uncharacterized protein n=1 Tax=Madurella mycetomatis TaxID=100816 RepID=A0A175VZY4_9PEZI|nr:hypothetical protein MMYC01_206652 [Madurella mycetomatis]
MATSLTAATVTTVFTPDPTCFAASNLWTINLNCVWSESTPPSPPTLCPYTVLGPTDLDNCKMNNPYNTEIRGSAFSDCPVGMTVAATGTGTLLQDVTIISTACCPTAYSFAGPNLSRSTITYTSGGRTWWLDGQAGDRMCKATSVQELSGQMVTVTHRAWRTVLASGTTSTEIDDTTLAWDYEDGTIWATPASIWQYIYPGEGTTPTCFGTNCPATNTLAPTPTQRSPPSFTYIPPPPHAMTQFTPAPSCFAESNLWIASTYCFVPNTRPEPDPSWLECLLTLAGEPNVSNRECHRFPETATVGADGIRTFYSACPAGYSVATSRAWGLFNEPTNAHGEPSPTRTYDATVTNLICCPSGTYDFKYAESLGSLRSSTTVHDGATHTIHFYPVPECVATSVLALSGKEIPFKSWSETRFWGEKRQEIQTITRTWDFVGATLWAQAEHVTYTAFRDVYTCFESDICNRYFSETFKDKVPNTLRSEIPAVATPGPGATPAGTPPGGAVPSSSTDGGPERGRGPASIVVTLVAIVTVVIGLSD